MRIDKEKMQEALKEISPLMVKSGNAEILYNILISAQKDKTELVLVNDKGGSGFNFLKSTIKTQNEKVESLLVNAIKIKDIVGAYPNGEIDIVQKDNKVLVTSGDLETAINVGNSIEDFPNFPTFKPLGSLTVNAKELYDGLYKTIFASSNDETRYNLNGVYFRVSKNKLNLVATDSHRLVTKKIKIAGSNKRDMVVHNDFLRKIMPFMKNAEKDIKITWDKVRVSFKVDNKIMVSKVVDGQYPQYESIIPKKTEASVSMNREQLITVLERGDKMVTPDKSHTTVFEGDNVSFGQEHNTQVKDKLNALMGKFDLKVAFNAIFLLDILKRLEEDTVRFEMIDDKSPMLIKEKDLTHILMPIRV